MSGMLARLALLGLLPLAGCGAPQAAPDSSQGAAPSAAAVAVPEPAQVVRANADERPAVRTRLTPTLNQPLGLWLGGAVAPTAAGEAAPLPNRDIEAPRARVADRLAPRIEPMLLPPERRLGATFGAEHLRETGPDRPFDNVLPGARLRIPFESESPR